MLKRRVVRDPKKEAITFGLILLVAVGIFFAVLNYRTRHSYQASTETVAGTLHYSLHMPATSFAEGQDIPIQLTVRNIGNEPVVLKFDQELEFDVIVKRDVNMLFATVPFDVWKYSASHPGAANKPHERVLKPGGTLTYNVAWPQVDANNEKVAEGRYTIVGVLNQAGSKTLLQLSGGTHD